MPVLPCNGNTEFPASRRLLQRFEFEAVLAGKGLPNKWFVIYRRPNETGVSRLGIVASKRVMPTAVSRNLAKRVVREMFRQHFPQQCGLDLVVRVRRRVQRETLSECREALAQLFGVVQTV